MESKPIGFETPTAPTAVPSYEEATKCASTPMGQMMNIQPQHYPMVESYQPSMVQSMIIQAAPALQQSNYIGGGLMCQSCQMPLHTRIAYRSTCCTHMAFLLCCLFICIPCAPFVYCTNSCREPQLKCVNCGCYI